MGRNDPTVWTSALHLAPKKDGDVRACGDFRPLNNKTILDTYPLPNIKTFADKLCGATIFTILDLKSAYYQIPLSLESSYKTAVVTPWGTWRFKRLAMGLKNFGQSFQKMLGSIMTDQGGLIRLFR